MPIRRIALSASLLLLTGCSSTMFHPAAPAGTTGQATTLNGHAVRAPGPEARSLDGERWSRSRHEVAFGDGPTETPARTGDGRHAYLYDVYGDLGGRPFGGGPGRGMDAAGNVRMITVATEGGCFQPAIDRNGGRMVYSSTQHRPNPDLYIKSVSGRTHTQLTKDPGRDIMPAISPDGQYVAFSSDRHGDFNIYVLSMDGGQPMQITDSSDHELHPSFSPDGRQLVYCREASHSGRWEMWVVDLETRMQTFLAYGLFPEWNPAPAPSRIVFQRPRERGDWLFSVWTLEIVKGEAMHETEIISASNAATMHPTWSPDGKRIAFVTMVDPIEQSSEPQQSDIYVINRDGTGRTNLTNGQSFNLYPVWSTDGSVFFTSDRTGNPNIYALNTGRTIRLGGYDTTTVRGEEDRP